MSHRNFSSLAVLPQMLKKTAAVSGAALGAVAVLNAVIAARTPPLSFRLGGEFGRYPARFGDIAYTVAGSGAPILLLHGLEAGRSMAEWRAIFGPLSENHTVYALDFPGWGLSDATREGYNATDFAEVISHFIKDIIGSPTTVIAAGEAGIFAALAARGGAPIQQLILSCPVPPALDAPSGESRAEAMLQRTLSGSLLNAPVLGTAALNWARSRANLAVRARFHGFFDKDFGTRESELWHVAAHQKGADFGQKCFLQGAFSCDWRAAWSEIEVPSLLIWGRNALREGYASAPEWLTLRPDAHLEVVENALLFPHLEQPERFLELVSQALQTTLQDEFHKK
ncbi:Pimeloyl-ACP methyl ester carboxylesterase [Abditibacterium utsteinense]|uniref:Pimeloyl-ACP methyl ester carboxylesterase n=1 Tax=Abditibacterium utsteinense TaxID=1960156 RepID=A0A2S8SXD9_9BACT|nr:alpha/beta hydrolase [Abditibacterium utsteinense]PQV65467.1 Pimeloyl-ACP methyl ester carboxylesterase [Abditibacterium utsteinense]